MTPTKCGDCIHFPVCYKLFHVKESNTRCEVSEYGNFKSRADINQELHNALTTMKAKLATCNAMARSLATHILAVTLSVPEVIDDDFEGELHEKADDALTTIAGMCRLANKRFGKGVSLNKGRHRSQTTESQTGGYHGTSDS